MTKGEIIQSERDIWGKGGPYTITKCFPPGGEGEAGAAEVNDRAKGRREVFIKEIGFITLADQICPPTLRAQFEAQQNEVLSAFAALVGKSFVCSPLHFFVAQRPRKYFQVLEFIKGEDLEHYFEGAGLAPQDRIFHARMIADGLASIHESGLAMIDLKPGNIRMERKKNAQGREIQVPMVIDLTSGWKRGWAGMDPSGKNRVSIPRGVPPFRLVYTEEWRSPEIYFFEKWMEKSSKRPGDNVDQFPSQASDVFIASRILYELLTGRPPLGDRGAAARRQFIKTVWEGKTPIANPASAGAPISAAQGEMLLRGFARKPGDRPTMRELHRALIGAEPTVAGVSLSYQGQKLTLEPGKSLTLLPQMLRPLQVPWTANLGLLLYAPDSRAWVFRFTPGAVSSNVSVNGTAVQSAARPVPLRPGRNTLKVGSAEVVVTVA